MGPLGVFDRASRIFLTFLSFAHALFGAVALCCGFSSVTPSLWQPIPKKLQGPGDTRFGLSRKRMRTPPLGMGHSQSSSRMPDDDPIRLHSW